MTPRKITELDEWPRCPQCHAPRTTHCPICETAGIDFRQVDPAYAGVPDDGSPAAPISCGGQSACTTEPCQSAENEAGHEQSLAQDPAEAATGMMVLCPTCDEPFVPEHPDRCEWCGHRFPDGYPVDVAADEPEEFNSRVIGVMLALAILLLALALYFTVIF